MFNFFFAEMQLRAMDILLLIALSLCGCHTRQGPSLPKVQKTARFGVLQEKLKVDQYVFNCHLT